MAKPRSIFRTLFVEVRLLNKNGFSLQWRSFTFFILFLFAVMAGIFLVLFSTGAFSVGSKECQVFLENELGHIAQDIMRDFSTLSVEGVLLAERLTEQIEKRLETADLNPSVLKANPQLLEVILSEAMERLIAALEKNKSSGVFLTLDATINQALSYAEQSRAGLFLKNMEPNIINLATPAIRFMRGPASIGRQNNLSLLPQWQMEFTVAPDDFFFTTMQAAADNDLPLSRLYYWHPCSPLVGNYEHAMLLCVPLITSDGVVIGVCGFEVSAMLFKLINTPHNTTYTRIFSMLAPLEGSTLDASKAIYAGNYSALPLQIKGTIALKTRNGISRYVAADGSIFAGLHQVINLYPKTAAFSTQQWVLAVLIPEEDLTATIRKQNRQMIIFLLLLLLFSMGAAALISRRSVAPVVDALEQVKTHKASKYAKTNIHEIDDLIAFLASQDAADPPTTPPNNTPEVSTLCNDFVENIKTLSPAERAVFDLYMEGYTAQEITKILYLSINTIKTHNKKIYQKLNVTSRKELLVYVKMMREKDVL